MTEDPPPFVAARPALAPVYAWASEQHETQRRDVDNAPFILHPLEVASMLSSRGQRDAVVAAGLLHDALEKTGATLEEVRARFGDEIAGIVAAVTEDEAIADYLQRKAALRAAMAAGGPDAHAVYAADKVAKARELRAHAALDPAALSDPALQRRLAHYEQSLDTLRQSAGDLPLVDQLEFELWALRSLPPQ